MSVESYGLSYNGCYNEKVMSWLNSNEENEANQCVK
jgi:hypothetical protein